MLRMVFGRAATGAAAAGTAGAVAAATTQAHAHARPMRLIASGPMADDRTASGGAPPKLEDGWVVPQVQGGEVVFTPEEIEQTLEEICGIASGGSKVYSPSEAEAVDAVDNRVDIDANAVIDQADILPAGEGLQKLMKMTSIMLNRPTIQHEIMQAFQQEPELRDMMESLSSKQGCELELLPFSARSTLPTADPRVRDITDAQPKTLLQALMHDIGRGLEIAGDSLARTGVRIGNFLGRIGQWLRARTGGRETDPETENDDLTNSEKIIGMTMCFAAVVMAVMVAKRTGMFHVMARR